MWQKGGDPVYRESYKTDLGNQIIDVYGMGAHLAKPFTLAGELGLVPGLVGHGLFVYENANKICVGYSDKYDIIEVEEEQ